MCAGDGSGDRREASVNLPVVFVAAIGQHLNPVFLAVEFAYQSCAGYECCRGSGTRRFRQPWVPATSASGVFQFKKTAADGAAFGLRC